MAIVNQSDVTQSTTTPRTFYSLEGLRGLLALAVVASHFNAISWLKPFGLKFNFQLAVDMFFILSGFVLMHSNYALTPAVRAWPFVVKRFARLYPLHLVTFAAMAMLLVLQNQAISPWSIVRQVFLLHGDNYGTPHFNGPSWSIAVEFWCSVLFLFVFRWFASASDVARRLGLLFAGVFVAMTAALLHSIIFDDPAGSSFPGWGNYARGVAGFTLGLVGYSLAERFAAVPLQVRHWLGWASSAIIAGFFFLDWHPATAIAFYGASLALVVTLAVTPSFLPVLSSRVCVWLGAISYSVYLLHVVVDAMLVHFFAELFANNVPAKLLRFPLVLALASVTYTWFERPAQTAIRNAALAPRKPVFGRLAVGVARS